MNRKKVMWLLVVGALSFASCARSGGHGGTITIDMLESPSYVRVGFNNAEIGEVPSGAPWREFAPGEGVDSLAGWDMEGLPKTAFLSPLKREPVEFTVILPFTLSQAQWTLLARDMTRAPGVYIPGLGENWQVYMNGALVKEEMYRDAAGRIRPQRRVLNVFFILPREVLRVGQNILAIRVVGDPACRFTGFFYRAPFYISWYDLIAARYSETRDIVLISSFFFIALYNLIFYLFNRLNRHNFYCALFSFILGLYYLVRARVVYAFLPDTEILFKIELTCAFMAAPAFGWFLENFNRGHCSRFTKMFSVVYALMSLAQWVFPSKFGTDLLLVWQFSVLPVVIALIIMDVIVPFTRTLRGVRKWFATRGIARPGPGRMVRLLYEQDTAVLSVIMLISIASGAFDVIDSAFLHLGIILSRYVLIVYAMGTTLILTRRQVREGIAARMEREQAALEAERAKAASAAKSTFLAQMSHEIRTPMNVIIGTGEVMRTDNLDPAQARGLRDMVHMARHLLEIINDILDFSKIEAGKMELAHSPFSLRGLFNDVASLGRFLTREKGLAFRTCLENEAPEVVCGDEMRVRQIAINLLTNAVKYTPQGAVELRMGVAAREEVSYLTLEVRDTGLGIKEEDQKRLFNRFERFDAEKNRDVSGTGLGLAITRQLLDLMGGFIEVESVYGQGSLFKAYIPLKQAEPGEAAAGEEVLSAGSESPAHVQAAEDTRVLVVDDMRVNLSVAAGYLAQHGITPDTAESGRETLAKALALWQAEGKVYDLIFMDHMMPGMDGVETTKRYRAWEEKRAGPRTAIVALSANAVSGVRELFLSSGMDDFLSKPIRTHELNRVLTRWLPREKLSFAPEKPQAPSASKTPSALFAALGLDESSALRNLGSVDGVERFLKTLALDYDACLRGLEDACQARDWREYAVRAHAFKGVFTELGRQDLAEQGRRLEEAAKEGTAAYCEAETPAFLDALRSFREALFALPLLSAPTPADAVPERGEVDAAYLRPRLEALHAALLSARSRETRRLAGELDALTLTGPGTETWREAWPEIRALLDTLELPRAAERLALLLRELH